MPKVVDHEARRTEIAEATWIALQEIAIERLRLRDIADEVGFTTGVFAHYFRDKSSVLRYAFSLAYQRATEEIERANATESSSLARLKNTLVALVPDKKRPETVAFVSLCFGIRSVRDPLLTADYKKKRKDYARLVKSCLIDALDDEEIVSRQPLDEILDLIFATLDGVCVTALLNPDAYSKKRGARILETMISRLARSDEAHFATRRA